MSPEPVQEPSGAVTFPQIPGGEVQRQWQKTERGGKGGPVSLTRRIVAEFGRELPQRDCLVERSEFDLLRPTGAKAHP